MTVYLGSGAVFFYLFSTTVWVSGLLEPGINNQHPHKPRFFAAGFTAILLHAGVLYQNINTLGGFNLGFYNALSLMGFCISLIVLLAALSKPLENLSIVIFPMTSVALLMEMIFKSSHVLPDSTSAGIKIHVLLSVCAYSLLTIAAIQAGLLALQDRQISRKHPATIMRLPPLQIMEDLLIQIIAIGFFMLSLSLATGMMFVNDLLAQHLSHKLVFSVLAWIIFGILLWGRWARGWRGKKAIRWTLGGFLLLLLAYFGSKFVLELVLERV